VFCLKIHLCCIARALDQFLNFIIIFRVCQIISDILLKDYRGNTHYECKPFLTLNHLGIFTWHFALKGVCKALTVERLNQNTFELEKMIC
jgi:hypothetical protein